MGRRHRDIQQARRRSAAAAPGRRPRAGRPRRGGGSGLTRYLTDLAGILVIALLVSLLLRELGMVNYLLRVIVALVIGRVVVSLVRRSLDART